MAAAVTAEVERVVGMTVEATEAAPTGQASRETAADVGASAGSQGRWLVLPAVAGVRGAWVAKMD